MLHLKRVLALAFIAAAPALAHAQADKLTVMSAANVANLAHVYLLETTGYAKEEGLDYSVKTALANALNLVVAGEGDLAAVGPSAALVPVREGKETSIIFALGSGTAVGFLAGTAKIKAITDCTRVSTSQAGTSTYSIAMTYKAATGATFNVLGLGDANQITPSVLTGSSDCALTALGLLQPGLEKGLHLVVDPRIPSTIPPNTIQDSIGSAYWGMKDNLQKKRPAVEKLLRAMKRLEQYIKTASVNDLAASLLKHPDFKTYKQDVLARQIELEKMFWFPENGYIRGSTWPSSLRFFQYGLPFIDPANKLYSWDSRVDMTYWTAVYGQPARK